MPHSAVKLAMAALVVAGGACSSGDRETPAPQPSTTSSPAGEAPDSRVVGREPRFGVETLAAPAGVGPAMALAGQRPVLTRALAGAELPEQVGDIPDGKPLAVMCARLPVVAGGQPPRRLPVVTDA